MPIVPPRPTPPDWRTKVQIIENYLPKYPRLGDQPALVVVFYPDHDVFLRDLRAIYVGPSKFEIRRKIEGQQTWDKVFHFKPPTPEESPENCKAGFGVLNWDVYGSDFLTREKALTALLYAPPPRPASVTFTFDHPEKAEKVKTVSEDGSGDTCYYVHRNPAQKVFVKAGSFFVEQGGLTAEWGKAWTKVEASQLEESTLEAAREWGKKNLPKWRS